MSEGSGGWRAPWARMLALVGFVVALDQVTKAIVVDSIARGQKVEILPFLDFVYVKNEGVAFGFLGGSGRGVVLAVTAIALVLVVGWFASDPRRRGGWLAVGFLVGGAVGNLIDRVARDAVVDFIDFPAWPSFNIADIAITLGAISLALVAFRAPDDERTS